MKQKNINYAISLKMKETYLKTLSSCSSVVFNHILTVQVRSFDLTNL